MRFYILFVMIAASLCGNTQPVLQKYDVISGNAGLEPATLHVSGHKIYMRGKDSMGMELWQADTANGPSRLFDLNTGSSSGLPSTNVVLTEMNGVLYFTGDNGNTGNELYKWDGSNPATMVYDLNPGPPGSTIMAITPFNGKIFYFTGVGVHEYNPSSGNTRKVPQDGQIVYNFGGVAAVQNKLAFSRFNSLPLMYYDAVQDTILPSDNLTTNAGLKPYSLKIHNNKVYYHAEDGINSGRELYVWDGVNPPAKLKEVLPGYSNGIPNSAAMAIYNNCIYFPGYDSAGPFPKYTLYKYDLLLDSISKIYRFDHLNSYPQSLELFKGKLYFTAKDAAHGRELWVYDFVDSPKLLLDVWPGTSDGVSWIIPVQNYLYLQANDGVTGPELYRFADTSSGPISIQNISFTGEVNVYPNPASDKLNIELSLKTTEKLNIRLMDITGREVHATGLKEYAAGKSTVGIPMKGLSTGTYFYHISNAAGRTYGSGKVVKE